MTYKQALLLLLQHPKRSSRSMVFSYVLAAFGAMAVVFGLCHSAYIMGVPWWILKQQGIPTEHLWELIPIDAIGLISLCLGLVAAFVGLVKAHYKSLGGTEKRICADSTFPIAPVSTSDFTR